MDKKQTLFAFELASQHAPKDAQDRNNAQDQWQPRDGVAIAGCTDPTGQGLHRYGTRWSSDNGVWC